MNILLRKIYVIMIVVGGMLGYVYKRAEVVKKGDSDSAYEVIDGHGRKIGFIKNENKENDENAVRKLSKVIEKSEKKKKTEKKYKATKIVKNVYGIKTFATVGIQLLIIAVMVVMIMQIIEPKKDYYERADRTSSLKMENQEKVAILHFSGGKLNGTAEFYRQGRLVERFNYKDNVLDGDGGEMDT